MLIGITGGIASGKSLVSHYLMELGLDVIDIDEIAREVVRPGCKAWAKITAQFGRGFLTSDGEIDRKKLGDAVFKDHKLLKKLNAITHPEIRRKMWKRIEVLRGDNHDALIFIDVPLLIESGFYKDMDRVVLVYVDEAIQIKRLIKRDGLSDAEAQRRLSSQMPIDKKLKLADYVIYNDGSVEETKAQVRKLLLSLKQ